MCRPFCTTLISQESWKNLIGNEGPKAWSSALWHFTEHDALLGMHKRQQCIFVACVGPSLLLRQQRKYLRHTRSLSY